VQLPQDGCVLRVLVDSHKLTQIHALQARNEILAHKTHSPGDYDFSL
jgi:hypothetical protein